MSYQTSLKHVDLRLLRGKLLVRLILLRYIYRGRGTDNLFLTFIIKLITCVVDNIGGFRLNKLQ